MSVCVQVIAEFDDGPIHCRQPAVKAFAIETVNDGVMTVPLCAEHVPASEATR